MRPLEWLIIVLLASAAVLTLLFGSSSRSVQEWMLMVGIFALIGHLKYEGAHWQFVPGYLGMAAFTWLIALKSSSGMMRTAMAWLIVLLVADASALSLVLPMFRLPRPTGPFIVGTRTMYLVDESRSESEDPGRKRELMIQLWYPAILYRGPKAPYRQREETTPISSYQSVLATHSLWNAPVAKAEQPFPLLLFNPGWNGRRTSNTYLVEDLAAHGYIVIGIDHTYNSGPTAFPDGRVIQARGADRMDFASKTLQEIESAGAQESARQVADDLFVLDRMQEINLDPTGPFYQRIDACNVGALGFSFGGSVAAQACSEDPRIRSALDLDGSLFGPVQQQGLPKPFMFIQEEVSQIPPGKRALLSHADQIDGALSERDTGMFEKYGGYRIYLRGTSHESFTDRIAFSPLRRLSGRGQIPTRRHFRIIREYARAFFDKTLKGKDTPLLQSQISPFPEASFHIVHPKG